MSAKVKPRRCIFCEVKKPLPKDPKKKPKFVSIHTTCLEQLLKIVDNSLTAINEIGNLAAVRHGELTHDISKERKQCQKSTSSA
jgi:hypothetical protein